MAEPLQEAPAANDMVRREWLRRVEAEYRSAAFTQHLTLWLTQLAAPPELLELGLRVATDELAHAELSAEVYRQAGGTSAPQLTRETLALSRTTGAPLELDVLRYATEQFCLGETVAVRLFQRMRKRSSVPCVLAALTRIVRDEANHRDFGWATLDWLLSTPMEQTFRSLLARELPAMMERMDASYGGQLLRELGRPELAAREASFDAAAHAWGLISTAEYVAAVDETVARDYAPRLAELGITCPTLESRS